MQFIVLGYDDTDEGAIDRRLAARDAHLKSAMEMVESGKWLYAAAILDDNGKMTGSMIICEFSTRDELERLWLNHEPYVTGNVWKTIEIKRAQIAPFCLER